MNQQSLFQQHFKKRKMEINWSKLPKELLFSISECLATGVDLLRFRSVCTSWRSSSPPQYKHFFPALPLNLPVWISPNDRVNRDIPGYFNLTERTIYSLAPVNQSSDSFLNHNHNALSESTGWLVKLKQQMAGKMQILPLLSNFKRCCLSETFPNVINLSNFRISVITKAYDIQFILTKGATLNFCGDYYCLQADKVVVSSKPGGDYAIMAMHSGGRLGFFRAGGEKWSVLDDKYDDIISYNGGFCAIDGKGKAVEFDFFFKASRTAEALPERVGGDKKHLVEIKSTGDLLLVDRFLNEVWGKDFCTITANFKVYKLNRDMQRWDELKSLGDMALFVGQDCTFSISAQDCPGMKGNCIFYNCGSLGRSNRNADPLKGFLSRDTGVFSLEDQSVRPLATRPNLCNLFWPPPNLGN